MLIPLSFKRLTFLLLVTPLVLAACSAPTVPVQAASGATEPVGTMPVKPPLLGSLPAVGDLSIEVNAGETQQDSSVTLKDANGIAIAPGTPLSEHPISDNELRGFGIDGQDGLVNYYQTRILSDIFKVCANECSGFNFSDYPDHTPVTVQLAFQSASIIEFHAENTALASEKFANDSSVPATYTTSLAVTKTNSSTTSWNSSNSFTFNQSIKYKVGFLGTGGGGSTGLSYNHSWGEGGSDTSSTTIGTTSGISVPLEPHRRVTATLSATQGTAKIRVVYAATITGGEVVTWVRNWGTMEIIRAFTPFSYAFSLPTTRLITQDIDIGYFSGGKIELKDDLGHVLFVKSPH